jgi:two-component system sensor histidine kinase KdpD
MMQDADGDSRQRFAAIIERQAERLNTIVDGVIDAYRARDGELTVECEWVDVAELLDELASDYATLYPRHRFVVNVEGSPQIETDRRLLGMVISNLLSNAAKYAPPGTTVEVTSRRTSAAIHLRVDDEGPGVPEHVRGRMFEAGERGRGHAAPGCGLGLFIADILCRALGGTLAYEQRPGGGASFALSLGWQDGAQA